MLFQMSRSVFLPGFLLLFLLLLLPTNGFLTPEPGKSLPPLLPEVWEPPPPSIYPNHPKTGKKIPTEEDPPKEEMESKRYADYPFLLHGEKKRTERDTIFAVKDLPPPSLPLDTPQDIPSHKKLVSEFLPSISIPLFRKDPNRKSRMLENRAYSKTTNVPNANHMTPPILQDLSPSALQVKDTFWSSIPAGLLSFGVPYLIFPTLLQFLDPLLTSTLRQDIPTSFGPGVSILYGTFVSLTLSILYKRQDDIQTNVATESSLLSLTARNIITLLKETPMLAVSAGQAVADQIRMLCDGSRGDELMLIMYNDPYARILQVLEEYEDYRSTREEKEERMMIRRTTMTQQTKKYSSGLLEHCRQSISELCQLRANRLSNESLALPNNHFVILTSLTTLILFGYTIQIAMDMESVSHLPSNESRITFGVLCMIYTLFYNFAMDLNDPFAGIYQVRRSATVSHLLQSKWMILHHPVLQGKVDFNPQEDVMEEEDVVVVKSPGLEEMLFRHL